MSTCRYCFSDLERETSSPWFQWNRPISVKKPSFSRPVSLFKSIFFSPIIILFLQYSHKKSYHVPEMWPSRPKNLTRIFTGYWTNGFSKKYVNPVVLAFMQVYVLDLSNLWTFWIWDFDLYINKDGDIILPNKKKRCCKYLYSRCCLRTPTARPVIIIHMIVTIHVHLKNMWILWY
jgi:hypothetical protein